MSLETESLRASGGDTIIRSRKRITSALDQISLVKSEMVTLKSLVDADLAGAGVVYTAADQTAVNAVLVELKATVQQFAAAL